MTMPALAARTPLSHNSAELTVMPYEIVWEPKGVYRRYFGRSDGAELTQSILDVEGDQRFDELRYVINDMLDSDEILLSSNTMTEISAVDGAAELSNPNIRIAIVADKPAILAVAHAYATAGLHTYPTRIFSNLADARAWLAQPAPLDVKRGSRGR